MLNVSNYCIGSLRDLQDMALSCCQYTINGRLHPTKRNVLKPLVEFSEADMATDVVVHYDFVYLPSRYGMFNESTKSAMVGEAYALMMVDDVRVKGVVMHTDWPIKKSVMVDSSKIMTEYASNLWVPERICDAYESGDALEFSLRSFYDALKARFAAAAETMHIGVAPLRKLYLENTVHIGPSNEGSVSYLCDLIVRNGWDDLFGVCVDTEHAYAGEGLDYCDVSLLDDIPSEVDLIYHLNAVPSQVKPCSRLDRHSDTTLFECSLRTVEQYAEIIAKLDMEGIPWVREVSQETQLREQTQLRMWNAEHGNA